MLVVLLYPSAIFVIVIHFLKTYVLVIMFDCSILWSLQLEIIKIKRTDQDDEKAVSKDYSDLLATYETKIHVSVLVYFIVSKLL